MNTTAQKTEISIGSDYMNFVYEFHKAMVTQRLTLVYEGEVNQSITKAFTSLAERNMDEADENTTIKKRVYHVMVECLQNICKHSDDVEGRSDSAGTGIFMVGEDNTQFTVTTGNVIANARVPEMMALLDRINDMDTTALKELHKKQMRESRLSEKGGAGLGLIDIARKTGNKLDYAIETINDEASFFVLKTQIDKKNDSPNA
ncbi:MAG: SiaB family protein kinase [Bacteroidota bacterium]